MVTCVCGHRAYAGYVAEADSLAARSSWLADRVAAGDPAPAAEIQSAYAIWSPPGGRRTRGHAPAGPPGSPAPPDRTRGAPSAQTILLGVGALLLVIAGAVFAAVVWDRLGAIGQVALMLTATAGVGALAIRLRTRLEGTAEALAVVAAGLATVDLLAAPMLGLLPEHWVTDPTMYPAIALGALGIALLLLHRRFGLRAWSWLGWTGLLVASGCVVAAVASATDSAAWTAAAIAVPALTSVAMLAASEMSGRWSDHAGRAQDRGHVRPAPQRRRDRLLRPGPRGPSGCAGHDRCHRTGGRNLGRARPACRATGQPQAPAADWEPQRCPGSPSRSSSPSRRSRNRCGSPRPWPWPA